jgi:hypothetical protein
MGVRVQKECEYQKRISTISPCQGFVRGHPFLDGILKAGSRSLDLSMIFFLLKHLQISSEVLNLNHTTS